MSRKKHTTENSDAIVNAILAAYLEGRDAVTAKDLAERLDITPATARKRVNQVFHDDRGWLRITPTTAVVRVYGKNYGEFLRDQEVQAWTPTKRHIANLYALAREG